MNREETLALYAKGRDAWNAWEQTFAADADFSGFVFPGSARFICAAFSGTAGFTGATFSGDARFDNAAFADNAGFTSATFTKTTVFDNAAFHGRTSFYAAEGKGAFSLAGARFDVVPDFIQAHFGEAPRPDNVPVGPPPVQFFSLLGSGLIISTI